MNWKEFLRPTIAKIAVAFLLFAAVVPSITIWIQPDSYPEIGLYNGGAYLDVSIFYVLYGAFFAPASIRFERINFLQAILGVILSYLVACLLASLYSKYAKKVKK